MNFVGLDLTVADGHLGIWSALGELHPTGDEQRCWNHKIACSTHYPSTNNPRRPSGYAP